MPNMMPVIYLKINLMHKNVQFLLEDAQFGALPDLNRYIFLNFGYAANFK